MATRDGAGDGMADVALSRAGQLAVSVVPPTHTVDITQRRRFTAVVDSEAERDSMVEADSMAASTAVDAKFRLTFQVPRTAGSSDCRPFFFCIILTLSCTLSPSFLLECAVAEPTQ